MAKKYGKKAAKKVERAMRERKRGKLTSGRSGKKVTSRKQAIAIGLNEARREGADVPEKPGKRTGRKKKGGKKKAKKSAAKKTASRQRKRKTAKRKTARSKQGNGRRRKTGRKKKA